MLIRSLVQRKEGYDVVALCRRAFGMLIWDENLRSLIYPRTFLQ